jgi:hypothetical protein
MFNPSKDEVRQFFCTTWKKSMQGEVLTPLEAIASDWIRQHPEYESDLADTERALEKDYSVDQGRSNPFLHLSMHLSIHEQISVDLNIVSMLTCELWIAGIDRTVVIRAVTGSAIVFLCGGLARFDIARKRVHRQRQGQECK